MSEEMLHTCSGSSKPATARHAMQPAVLCLKDIKYDTVDRVAERP
jgi:hypothetical protein